MSSSILVCAHVNSIVSLLQNRRQSRVYGKDGGEAGRCRRDRQERLTSPHNTHPLSPHSATSSVASPVSHLSPAWLLYCLYMCAAHTANNCYLYYDTAKSVLALKPPSMLWEARACIALRGHKQAKNLQYVLNIFSLARATFYVGTAK